jgi:hypothetical protein
MLSNLVFGHDRTVPHPAQKKMTEKVDVFWGFCYIRQSSIDMDFCRSNSVAVLAVLLGGGACAFFAPAACAGDRIDFSAPAIPLGVPRPEVEVKVPKGMIGSRGITGLMGSDAMAAPSQYFIVTPKTREKDVWDLDPILGDDPDQRGAGDSFTSRSDSARATNNNRLMKQGLNPNSSENQIQQRYGSGSEWIGEGKFEVRRKERFGQGKFKGWRKERIGQRQKLCEIWWAERTGQSQRATERSVWTGVLRCR